MSAGAATSADESVPSAPIVLDFSSYYDDLHRAVRAKSIPWDGYARANLISDADLALISEFDKQSNLQKTALISDKPGTYIPLFVRLLSNLLREDTVQYLLAVIDNVLKTHAGAADEFHRMSVQDATMPFAPFVKLLPKDDPFTFLASTKILIFLICTYKGPAPVPLDLGPLFSTLQSNLRHTSADVVDLTVQNVQSLLSVPEMRLPIYDFQGGKLVSSLLDVLSGQASPQIQYQVIFSLWLLSFEKDVAKEIEAKFHIITPLTDIAKGAIKEKVIRVVMALFRNLAHLAPMETTVPMIGSKLLPFLDILKQRKLVDTEITDDVDFLQHHLRESLHRLSSFDEYVGEVQSGKLEWSPAHESELFWKQNASKFVEKDGELVKALARLLNTSSDPIVLAVAAHDLGQFIKHYSLGKKILQDIGAKHRLMEMMTHENADVRYQALMAVQNLVSQSWAI
ncbi:ATPase, V1 complex, subunit H [Catenaria anguillulae PL171]|uniref:V-type proton ATPase subunit H n=1 Tax=Catenaria anguillulae PL171 TaxID=765915 RepID=A0A1Y2I158_9FUNG|nr:ATPase, V1 complex, subunit H [Catenaria anguillulae PL171]